MHPSDPTASFRSLLDANPDPMLATDRQGIIESANVAVTATLGFSEEELCARPLFSFAIGEDTRTEEKSFLKALSSEGRISGYRNRWATKNKTYLWLEWNAVLGPHGLVFATARDVTEQHIAENCQAALKEMLSTPPPSSSRHDLLKALFETTRSLERLDRQALYLVDRQSETLRIVAQRGFSEKFLQDAETLPPRGQKHAAFLGRAETRFVSHAEITENLHSVENREELRSLAIFPIRLHDVHVGTLVVGSHYQYEIHPTQRWVLTSLVDFTERRLTEEQNRERTALHEQYDSFLGHEVGNRLTPIVAMSDMLVRDLAPEHTRAMNRNSADLARELYERALATREFVQQLRILNAIEFGRKKLHFRTASVASLMDNTISRIAPSAEERGVAIGYQNESASAQVPVDFDYMPGALAHVLETAVGIASECDHERERRVDIRIFRHEGSIVVTTSVACRCLSESSVRRFSEKFGAVHHSNSAGFDLGITYALVVTEAHGGAIEVYSTNTEGTTIFLSLPLRQFESTDDRS